MLKIFKGFQSWNYCVRYFFSSKILGEVLQKETVSFPCGQDVSGMVVKVGEGVTNVEQEDDVVGKFLNSSPGGRGYRARSRSSVESIFIFRSFQFLVNFGGKRI